MSHSTSDQAAEQLPTHNVTAVASQQLNPERRLRNVLYVAALDATRKFGSLEEQVLLLAQQFRAHSACFLPLFLPGRDHVQAIREYATAGIEVEMLDLRRFRIAALRRLLGIVRRHAIEIVHWNFYEAVKNPYLWAMTVLAPSVKHYYTDHNSRRTGDLVKSRGIKSRFVRLLLRRYDLIFAVSDYVYESTEWAVGPLRGLRRCTHFVNTARFAPEGAVRRRLRKELDATGDFVLLVVANLIAEKGVDVALRALADLPESVILWVVGGGRDQQSLDRLARELGLGHRVRFLGLQRDVSPFMQAADVLVCPSLWGEAAGLVNIEALACGLPVIASQIGGIPEIVVDGETGCLFPPDDVQALADRVRFLQDDSRLRASMSHRARAVALQLYSPQHLLPSYLASYQLDQTPRS
jgi:glycosyltransferase involved in cell wall biosynthesis